MVVALTCALLIHAAADEVTPAQTATIERDQAKAQAQVSKKYGDKKPSELTPDRLPRVEIDLLLP